MLSVSVVCKNKKDKKTLLLSHCFVLWPKWHVQRVRSQTLNPFFFCNSGITCVVIFVNNENKETPPFRLPSTAHFRFRVLLY
ncbi:hypothetical protein V5799_019296 [Amblyomma americanum]|uniref:Uncharacterized protein n=1 Tax=Amblyomma americanum TaxID=6943 RepID=A0AAQ4EY40_AMBAM